MKPAGYTAKVIERPESWLGDPGVTAILSVSECISESPIDHTSLWLCNQWLLYVSPAALDEALARSNYDIATLRRFYYEAYPLWLLDGEWEPIENMPSGALPPPSGFVLKGYDIVCFSSGCNPECSPLSCNSGAKDFRVNSDCLVPDLDRALEVAERIDADGGYEPGPYAIMSVWEQAP